MYIILTQEQANQYCGHYEDYYFGAQQLTNGNYAALESEINMPQLESIKSFLETLPKQETIEIKQPR